jgi:hypothetical protein
MDLIHLAQWRVLVKEIKKFRLPLRAGNRPICT